MRICLWISIGAVATMLAGGCPQSTVGGERNAFLTLADVIGIGPGFEEGEGDGRRGETAEDEFRQTMTVTFANHHEDGELDFSVAAWVELSSVRSAEQVDALLRGGYQQLTREVSLGTVFTLPAGTFVFNGPGTAGSTQIRLAKTGLPPEGDAPAPPTTTDLSLITPDVLLIFSQPPVSCESVAFRYLIDGELLPNTLVGEQAGGGTTRFIGATGPGGAKTLAQIDAYTCDPLRPGLFLKVGGGGRESNEYLEGENVQFDFFEFPDVNGDFAMVTIQ